MQKVVDLHVDTKSKKFMFNLGKLFASGAKIHILNEDEVIRNIEDESKLGYAKSFNMMIKFWQDNNLSPNIYPGAGYVDYVFLICPIRNATPEEKAKLTKAISHYESKGLALHYPERDTNQNPVVDGVNTGGFNICLENARAIAKSNTVAMFYNKTSTGSMFDLGVACYLREKFNNRKFILENEINFDTNDYIDNILKFLLEIN